MPKTALQVQHLNGLYLIRGIYKPPKRLPLRSGYGMATT